MKITVALPNGHSFEGKVIQVGSSFYLVTWKDNDRGEWINKRFCKISN